MKIVPSSAPKDNEIGIMSMSITYTQNADTNSLPYAYQTLTIEAVPCDIGPYDTENHPDPCSYYNIKIGGADGVSNHWSIDNPDELTKIVKDFINRYKMVTDE